MAEMLRSFFFQIIRKETNDPKATTKMTKIESFIIIIVRNLDINYLFFEFEMRKKYSKKNSDLKFD